MPNTSPSCPSRRISATLAKHVAREFLIPFCCSLMAFAFLFVLLDVFDDLGDFTGAKAPWQITLLYFVSRLPGHLVNVIPFSVLLAACFMTMMLGRNNELCAMRAAGLSLAVCSWPVWATAVVAAVATSMMTEIWGPRCTRYAEELHRTYCESSKKKNKPQIGAYANNREHRDWSYIANRKDRNAFQDVIVRTFDDNGMVLELLAAKTAAYAHHAWTFTDGVVQTYAAGRDLAQPDSQTPFKTLTRNYSERPVDFHRAHLLLESTTTRDALYELRQANAPTPARRQQLRTIIWFNIATPLTCLFAAFFGVSMTIAHQRSEAVSGFACAVGIVVLAYGVAHFALVLGKSGWLPAFVAGALPTLLFTGAGVANVLRKQ